MRPRIADRLIVKPSTPPAMNALVRGIGPGSLIALMLNIIIGAGIFGLPSTAARILGGQSPFAYLIAAAGMGVIAACVAEVASRFQQAGGPYLYARVAFGRFLGLQTGWLLWLTRVSSAAAVANLFMDYLSEFWPQAKESVTRLAVITILIGGLALLNIRGVKMGTLVSNLFTIAKLVPLLIFVAAGLFLCTSAALPVLRQKFPGQEGFHLPGGVVFAASGILFALVVASRMGRSELIALAITTAFTFLNWLAVRQNPPLR
jgi:amino acid transporter